MLKVVAASAGMSAAKAHRYLVSFQRLGLVTQDPRTARYDLGPAALKLGLASLTRLDGVRMALANGDTVHFRQSGNAPEMRVYVETGSAEGTETLLGEMMGKLAASF